MRAGVQTQTIRVRVLTPAQQLHMTHLQLSQLLTLLKLFRYKEELPISSDHLDILINHLELTIYGIQ